jgi:YbbR domain-containing protein
MLGLLRQNLGTLLLAFILALTVWVAAINQDDPLIERTLENAIEISYEGLPEGKLIVNNPASIGIVTLRATRSTWDELSAQEVHLIADLRGLDTGTHQIPLDTIVDRQPVQVTAVDPDTLVIAIEDSASKELLIQVAKIGIPAQGYKAEEPMAEPIKASVVGPASAVARVVELRAPINLTNRQESLDQLVTLDALDEDGREVQEVDVVPEAVRVQVQITQQPNYRLVSVVSSKRCLLTWRMPSKTSKDDCNSICPRGSHPRSCRSSPLKWRLNPDSTPSRSHEQ